MIKINPGNKLRIKKRCREWRIANRYTMTDIAANAGVTRQAIRCFETGSGCTSRIIAGYLRAGMPVSELIDAAGIDICAILEG